MNTTVNWLPQYRTIRLPNDNLIVLDAQNEYLFEHTSFPLFHLINGARSLDEIASLAENEQVARKFLAVSNQLIVRNQFITSAALKTNSKVASFNSVKNNVYSNLGSEANKIIRDIQTLPETFVHVFTSSVTTPYLKPVIDKLCQKHTVNLIIVNQSNVILSPKLTDITVFETLLQRLFDNKPVLNLLNQYCTDELSCIPNYMDSNDELPNSIKQLPSILNALLSYPDHAQNNVLEYDLTANRVVKHPFYRLNSSDEIQAELVLRSRKVTDDEDGGSRCQSAKDTVDLLLPFVSPLTGQITHLEVVKQKYPTPVNTYKTAFFKTPAIKNIHNIDNESFIQICLGKGVTKYQSMASALCEAIERKNAQYSQIQPSVFAHSRELTHRHYHFEQIAQYSYQQYQNFSDPKHPDSARKQAVIQVTNEEINWQKTWSLTHNEAVYVPYVLCFANTPYEEDKYGKWQSNGCAAGNNLEEAILQGLFELIERDAVAIWWYNLLPRPKFDLSNLDPNYLNPLHQTLSHEHEYWVLDLTIDTGIAVMAAIGRNKQTLGWTFGFGCHINPNMAAQRALTELCQLIPIRDQNGAPFDFDAIENDDFLLPSSSSEHLPSLLQPSGDLKLDILNIVEQLNGLDMETLVLDYSQQAIPLKTVKIFVPGLCHIWPQLGNNRLYNTPKHLGLQTRTRDESTINQQGLYV
ncbi:YcaO-like family protein [Pseudoalteromonas luteoviolacea]|uniref:YcaO domain-containing protein n=1 Tax=Pseudoalteromonas luteoviolacea S4060-1 TaxID=1365257 RepID=A0A162C3I7_9GAMM|nr:YcaO-like family protein [Pseudoalteromonas luteoviolacea]KZN61574.1 hypothetical protein N478_05770 [Pseudoalteromonas luteoviolacea S4060-1]